MVDVAGGRTRAGAAGDGAAVYGRRWTARSAAPRRSCRDRLGASVAAIVVDFHAEASSEKMAFAHFLDGQVSAVVGTHTHCPSADAQILPGGTAFQSDAGMSGDYDSVIGMAKSRRHPAVLAQDAGRELNPAEGEATVCGVFVRDRRRDGAGEADRTGAAGRAARSGDAGGAGESVSLVVPCEVWFHQMKNRR